MKRIIWIGIAVIALALATRQVSAQLSPMVIQEEDGSPSSTPYQISFTNGTVTDNADGTMSVDTSGGAASGWTDDGTEVRLTTSTDEVEIGSAGGLSAKLAINGDADEIQLLVQANGTQTTNVFVVENSAGTDLFTVEGSGDVGIGIADPDGSLLHVHTASAGVISAGSGADEITVENSGDSGITIFSGDGNFSQIHFGSSGDTIGAVLRWQLNQDLMTLGTSQAGAELSFATAVLSEAMRIDSNGRVGIGDTTPDDLFVVGSSSEFQVASSGNITTAGTISLGGSTGGRISASGGVFTMGGIGNTNNENITFDLETSANIMQLGSETGVIQFRFPDLFMHTWGSGSDFSIRQSTTGSNDSIQFLIGVGAQGQSGYLNFFERADSNSTNRTPTSTTPDPTLRIYSADAVQAADYIEFSHNQTDGVIDVGNGVLSITTASDITGNLIVDNDADQIVLSVQGHSTQTNNLLVLENSGGTDQFTVNNGGDTTVSGAFVVAAANSLQVPTGAAPTADFNGEIAMDTNIISSAMGAFIGHDGQQQINLVSTTDTPGDNEIPKFDSGTGLITWEADAGAGGGGNTLDAAYDEGGAGSGRTIDADSGSVAITVSDTDNNETLTVIQNDTTNNPVNATFDQSGTGNNIFLDQDGNGIALRIDTEATTVDTIDITTAANTSGHVIDISANALTTGSLMDLTSSSADTGTRELIQLTNDNALATGATALAIKQDSTARGLFIDHNANGQALSIQSSATGSAGSLIVGSNTSGDVLQIQGSSVTTGSLLELNSNSSSASGRGILFIVNDHVDADDASAIKIQQDADGKGIDIELNANSIGLNISSAASSADTITIGAQSLSTGDAIQIKVDNTMTSGKAIRVLGGASAATEVFNVNEDGITGIGVASPAVQLQVDDAIAISDDAEGSTARLTLRTAHETHTLTLGATSDTTTISIPSGAAIIGCSMNVNTAVTDNGGGTQTWDATFITGAANSIATDVSPNQNTKVNILFHDAFEVTTATTQIQFSPNDFSDFTAGVIEIVVYYQELTSLADA